MIVYSLKCEKDHVFEDWFSSSSAFDEQAAKGELVCPTCNSHRIEKAPMAPSLGKSSGASAGGCPVAEQTGQMPPCAGSCGCFPG